MQSTSNDISYDTRQTLFQGDVRRHRRMPVSLPGRFMREDKSEHSCMLQDVSVGGARVSSDIQPELGEKIIAYFDDLGGLTGKVSRLLDGSFAYQFSISEHKREKLAAQIMWLANRDEFPGEAQRGHERSGSTARTTMKLDDGIIIDVELIDTSASGASIRTSARPSLGMLVIIGDTEAIVRRHHPHGIGVQFVTLQTEDSLRAGL